MGNTPTPHIAAQYGEIAKTVFMSGDPLRAKMIAETYLEDAVMYTDVRGVYGFTGTRDGKRYSVQGHGMGIPSIGIYSYELYNFYDVDVIVRLGTAGSYAPDLEVGTVIIADKAVTDSNYGYQYNLPEGYIAEASPELVAAAVKSAETLGVPYKLGTVFSSDVFYNLDSVNKKWADEGVLGVEMEAHALYTNAFAAGKKALTILTVSDNLATDEHLTSEERQNNLHNMIRIAFGM